MHRMVMKASFAIAVLLVLAVAGPALARDTLTVKQSAKSVKETADAFVKAVEEKGAKVFSRIDHGGNAKAAGIDMSPSELIIFGNPKLGGDLMKVNPEIGLDLPMKVLIWQDTDGKVNISYTDPALLAARHGLTGKDETLQKMSKALDGLTSAAASGN